MGHRLSRIVTKTGDDGTTGLADGSRLRKDSALIEAMGTIDELNSFIGLAESHLVDVGDVREVLTVVQHDLFDLGGALAVPGVPMLTDGHVMRLDGIIAGWNDTLPPLKEFILPGGSPAIAALHVARTVCRRAERRLLTAMLDASTPGQAGTVYLNRLSDLLFIAARTVARAEGQPERSWESGRSLR